MAEGQRVAAATRAIGSGAARRGFARRGWWRAARLAYSMALPCSPLATLCVLLRRRLKTARWTGVMCRPHQLPLQSPPLPAPASPLLLQALENRTLDSRREMDILNALDEMKSLKVGRGATLMCSLPAASIVTGYRS